MLAGILLQRRSRGIRRELAFEESGRPTSPKSFKTTEFLHRNLLWLHKKDSKGFAVYDLQTADFSAKKKTEALCVAHGFSCCISCCMMQNLAVFEAILNIFGILKIARKDAKNPVSKPFSA